MYNLLKYASHIIKQVLDGEEINLKGFHRNRISGLVSQMNATSEKYEYFQNIAETRFNPRQSIADITIITPEIAIIEVTEKGEFYGYFNIVNGRVSSEYSTDKEIEILIALAVKHEGLNSQFPYYACKMLGKEVK